jgi:outer membrane protein TolC
LEHAIAVLTGKAPAELSISHSALQQVPPPVPVTIPSSLLERRPDIASAERQMAAANEQIGIAKAAFYPQLTLSASAGMETSHFLQWFNWPSRMWSLGPQASQFIFDGGRRRASLQQAEALYDSSVAAYRQQF